MEAKQLRFCSSLPKTIFDLEDEQNELTKEDRLSFLSAYGIDTNSIQDFVRENDMLPMFPLLCKMFSTNADYKSKGCSFFREPYPILLEQLGEMEKENRLSYAALVLCMLNEGRISEKVLETDSVLKGRIYQYCKIRSTTDNWEIMEAISQMVGTYLIECEGAFTFLHDLIFEIVACHFGKKCSEEIINRMPSEFISRRLTLEDKEGDCLKIKIQESEYFQLAKRLYRDTKNLELYKVFGSEFLHNAKICDHFLSILENDADVKVPDIFVSLNTDFRDSQSVSIPMEKMMGLNLDEFVNVFVPILIEDPLTIEKIDPVVSEEYTPDFNTYYVPQNCRIRLISWVIAYGQEKILRYIINKILLQNEDPVILFGTDVESHARYLVLACHSKKANIVELVLNHTDPACKNLYPYLKTNESDEVPFYKRLTPLTFSVLQKSANIIDLLLKAGVDVNALDAFGMSPLHCAIYLSEINITKKLVAAGADVNKCTNGMPPLILAAINNSTDIVEFLLRSEAHCNYRMEDGETALYYASKYGSINMLKTLFKFGADYSIYKDNDKSPFCTAAARGHLSVLELLCEHGADCNHVDEFGTSPLCRASAEGFEDIVIFLLDKGADCNICDGMNYTPLLSAIENEHPKIASQLINKGADVNVIYEHEKSSPLHYAVKLNDIQTINALKKKTLIYRVLNSEGMTPLEISLWMGQKEVTKSLVEGENLSEQGKGNEHLFSAITKIRSSVLFLDGKDEVVAQDVRQPLYCKNDSLIGRILAKDEYGSLQYLLELGLRGDRIIKEIGKDSFWWEIRYESAVPIKCVCHFIVQKSVENENMQLFKLIIDHKFQKEAYTEYVRKPFLLNWREIFKDMPPYADISFHNQYLEKVRENPPSLDDCFLNRYSMDNSISILHLLSKHLTDLEFWKETDDPSIGLYFDTYEEDPEKDFINKCLVQLRLRMRRHSL